MNFFWVNQKQTYKQEKMGGYLWAPQKNLRGQTKWHWKTMTQVQPGDIIFNYVDGAIRSYCRATTPAYTCEKPEAITQEWEQSGYRVDVVYTVTEKPFFVMKHLKELGGLFPTKYSPVSIKHKRGNQIYLAKISRELGKALANKMHLQLEEEQGSSPNIEVPTTKPELHLKLSDTEKDAVYKRRTTQGQFRDDLRLRYNDRCAVTGLDIVELLVASHIKPWSGSTAKERNNPDNGLLLAVHLDKLFDRHLITFDTQGRILIANSLTYKNRDKIGLNSSMKLGTLTEGNQKFLHHHMKLFNAKQRP